jgi:hypothetical protein
MIMRIIIMKQIMMLNILIIRKEQVLFIQNNNSYLRVNKNRMLFSLRQENSL